MVVDLEAPQVLSVVTAATLAARVLPPEETETGWTVTVTTSVSVDVDAIVLEPVALV